MKLKIISIILLFLIAPLVIAEVDGETTRRVVTTNIESDSDVSVDADISVTISEAINEEIVREIKVMKDSVPGAAMRIRQLQRAALRAELTGQRVISHLIESEVDSEEISKLRAINYEIGLIKEEAESLNPESETIIEEFITIRKDLSRAIGEFRRIAGPLLNENEKQEIRSSVATNPGIAQMNAEVVTRIRETNAERVEIALGRIDKATPVIMRSIQSGEISPQEARQLISREYQDLNASQRRELTSKIIEETRERVVEQERIISTVARDYSITQRVRIENRLEQMPAEERAIIEENRRELLDRLNRVESQVEQRNAIISERASTIVREVNPRTTTITRTDADIRTASRDNEADVSTTTQTEVESNTRTSVARE